MEMRAGATAGIGMMSTLRYQLWRLRSGISRHQGEVALMAALTLIGVVLRVAWIVTIHTVPFSDFAGYQANATRIFQHHDAPAITMQGVGYPLALGMVYRLAGSNDIFVGKLFNVLLSTITMLLCYAIFKRLTTKKFQIYVAYAVVALLPNYIAYTSVLGTETLFTTLFATAVLLQLIECDWRIRAPLLGLVIGVAAITKPYFIAYPAVLALTEWLRHKDLKRILRTTVVACAVMLPVIAPVTYWNYRTLHMFVLNTYNAGINLFINSNSDNYRGGWIPLSTIHISPAFRATLLQHGMSYPNIPQDQRFAAVEPLFRAEAETWIIHHPTHYLYLGFLRVDNLFFSGADDVRAYALNGVSASLQTTSAPLSVFSRVADALIYLLSISAWLVLLLGLQRILATVLRRRDALAPQVVIPVLNIVFFTCVFFATEGQPRYAFPVLFLSAFCFAYLADTLRQAIQRDVRDRHAAVHLRVEIEEDDTLILPVPNPRSQAPSKTPEVAPSVLWRLPSGVS